MDTRKLVIPMIKNKKVITYIISFLCTIFILTNCSYALNTGNYAAIYTDNGCQSKIFTMGGDFLGVAQTIGMGVAVVMLVILGIKYIFSSPEDKATIKDKAVIYVTGAIIIFAASGLVGMIGKWATSTVK